MGLYYLCMSIKRNTEREPKLYVTVVVIDRVTPCAWCGEYHPVADGCWTRGIDDRVWDDEGMRI